MCKTTTKSPNARPKYKKRKGPDGFLEFSSPRTHFQKTNALLGSRKTISCQQSKAGAFIGVCGGGGTPVMPGKVCIGFSFILLEPTLESDATTFSRTWPTLYFVIYPLPFSSFEVPQKEAGTKPHPHLKSQPHHPQITPPMFPPSRPHNRTNTPPITYCPPEIGSRTLLIV